MTDQNIIVHILGENKLSSVLSDVTGDMGNLGNVMTGLFSTVELVKTGFEALSGVIAAGKSAFIDYNAQMETTKIALTTLLGNADDAEATFRKLHRLAANTPFEFPGLADAGKRLVAMGFSAKGAQDALEASANAAAALGKGQEGIDRIGLALGQTAVKAKASAEEMMQLAEVGVNPYEILQNKLGLTADQAANLGNQNISGRKVAEALVEGMQEQFAGSSKALSDSFTGMLATVKDDIAYILGDIGEPLFEALKEPLSKIRDFMADTVNSINDIGLGATLKNMLGVEVINGALIVWQTLKQTVSGLAEVIWSVLSAIANIGIALINFQTSINGFKTALGEGSSFITAFSAALAGTKTFLDVLSEAITFVSDKIANELMYVANESNESLNELSDTIADTVSPAFEFVADVIEAVIEAFAGFIGAIGELFDGISNITDSVLTALGGFADAIGTLFELALGGVLSIAGDFADGLYNLIVGGTDDTANDSSSIIGSYIDYFCAAFEGLQSSLSSIWNAIANTILSKVRWFVDRILGILKELSGYASGIVDFISEKVSNISNKFKANFDEIKKGITDATKVKSGPAGSGGTSMWRKEISSNGGGAGSGGGRSSGGRSTGTSAAEKAAKEAQKWAEKIDKDWHDLNKKLKKETESSYAQAIATLDDEYMKYYKDIEEAKNRGIDTTRLESTLSDYYKRVTEKLKKSADDALADMRSKTELLRADLSQDFTIKADVQYSDDLRKINEDIEKFKKSSLTNNLAHNEAVEDLVTVYKAQATLEASTKKINTEFKGLTTEMSDKLKDIKSLFDTGSMDLGHYIDQQIDVYHGYTDRLENIAANVKSKMDEALANEDTVSFKAWQNVLRDVNTELLEIKKNLQDLGDGTYGENLLNGIQTGLGKLKTVKQSVKQLGEDIVSNLNSTFDDFFNEAMTGKLKSFGDYCQSFFNSLAKSISSILSQIMTQWTINAVLGMLGDTSGFGKDFFGLGKKATGGYVSDIPKYAGGGNTFLVGENGPEFVTLNGGGAQVTSTHTTQRQLSENTAPNVTINVINQTGTEAKAETTAPKWDGESWVIGVVLNAVATNKNGMRSLIKGVATS